MSEKYYPVVKTLRLTRKEDAYLKERAAQMNLKEAAYLRYILHQNTDSGPDTRMLVKKLINEVNHIGVNINQIARGSNAGYFSEGDKQRLIAYLQKLNTTVEQVVKQIGDQ